MLPPLATLADLEARIGHAITDADEQARAEALLNDASALVRIAAHDDFMEDDGVTLGPVPDLAVTITCAAALRGWYNPAGIEAAQLGAVSVRYGGAWLTQNERDLLGDLIGNGPGSGALQQVMLKPGFGWDIDTSGYVPVDNEPGLSTPDADWFPLGTLDP
jgi:hypothetical protein